MFLFGNKSCAFEQMHQRTTVFFVICMRIRMYMNSACQTFDKSMSNDVVRYYCVVRPDEKFSQSQNVHTFAGGQHKVQTIFLYGCASITEESMVVKVYVLGGRDHLNYCRHWLCNLRIQT